MAAVYRGVSLIRNRTSKTNPEGDVHVPVREVKTPTTGTLEVKTPFSETVGPVHMIQSSGQVHTAGLQKEAEASQRCEL
jgi:hypothetical protein